MSESDEPRTCKNDVNCKVASMIRELNFEDILWPILQHLLEPDNPLVGIKRCDRCTKENTKPCKKGKLFSCWSCKTTMCKNYCYLEEKEKEKNLCFACRQDTISDEEESKEYYMKDKCQLCDDFQVCGYEHDSFVCDKCQKFECVTKEKWYRDHNEKVLRICDNCHDIFGDEKEDFCSSSVSESELTLTGKEV
jgi:hypothetical protein